MLLIRNHIKFIIICAITFFAQVFIFGNTNLFTWLNPLVYSIFVLTFPTKNRMNLIIYSFVLGFLLDQMFNTGGINAFAITFIAFIREPFWKSLSLIKEDKYSINTRPKSKAAFYFSVLILILIHHIIIFSIENFNINQFHYLVIDILKSTIITFVIISLLFSILRLKIINEEE